MTIELSEKTIGVWAVSIDAESDWLGACWRDGDNYVMAYRFRYYVDDLTFDSKDRKNWYECKVSVSENSEDHVVAAMRESARLLWEKSGGKRYEIMMDGGGIDRMLEDMANWPMVSMKVVPHDEVEES